MADSPTLQGGLPRPAAGLLFSVAGRPEAIRRALARAAGRIRAALGAADVRVAAPRATLEQFTVAELEELQRLVRRTPGLRSVHFTVEDGAAGGGAVRIEVVPAAGPRIRRQRVPGGEPTAGRSGHPGGGVAPRGRFSLGGPLRGRFRAALGVPGVVAAESGCPPAGPASRPAASRTVTLGPAAPTGAGEGPAPGGSTRPRPRTGPSPVPRRSGGPLDGGVLASERETLLVRRTLRSGQRVRFPGNVVVLGDVNPGAEIVAGGDVVVMGWLRGVAHAGAGGDPDAAICAFRLAPSQLRIAGLVARAPDGRRPPPDRPEVARVEEGMVTVAPYQSGRL